MSATMLPDTQSSYIRRHIKPQRGDSDILHWQLPFFRAEYYDPNIYHTFFRYCYLSEMFTSDLDWSHGIMKSLAAFHLSVPDMSQPQHNKYPKNDSSISHDDQDPHRVQWMFCAPPHGRSGKLGRECRYRGGFIAEPTPPR